MYLMDAADTKSLWQRKVCLGKNSKKDSMTVSFELPSTQGKKGSLNFKCSLLYRDTAICDV
jgi:hypothetical protein